MVGIAPRIETHPPAPFTATSCDAWFEILDAEGGISIAFVCARSDGHDAPHARGEYRWWGTRRGK